MESLSALRLLVIYVFCWRPDHPCTQPIRRIWGPHATPSPLPQTVILGLRNRNRNVVTMFTISKFVKKQGGNNDWYGRASENGCYNWWYNKLIIDFYFSNHHDSFKTRSTKQIHWLLKTNESIKGLRITDFDRFPFSRLFPAVPSQISATSYCIVLNCTSENSLKLSRIMARNAIMWHLNIFILHAGRRNM